PTELIELVEDSKEAFNNYDFYESKKFLEQGFEMARDLKSNYLAINLSDMLSTARLLISKINASEAEKKEFLDSYKDAKKLFGKKKYEKSEAILRNILDTIQDDFKITDIISEEPPAAQPQPEEGASFDPSEGVNISEPAPIVQEVSTSPNLEVAPPPSPPPPPYHPDKVEESYDINLDKLSEIENIFKQEEDIDPSLSMTNGQLFNFNNNNPIESKPEPPPTSRIDERYQPQALDCIQKIQSIISELKNFGANTSILERLSNKAKDAFKQNDFQAIASYVAESEDISKKLKIGYMESLLTTIEVTDEELGYLEYMIQQTEEAYEKHDDFKAEAFSAKFKDIVSDLMRGQNKSLSKNNFEFCRFCGETVMTGSKFCNKCGEKLK
ncbi:MAG: zinc ribbon domain-containing protein, partial [Thermoplasmata archaeon]|nr:zinc ribbon domain-containing protein [Thermoplasmata archaeon]